MRNLKFNFVFVLFFALSLSSVQAQTENKLTQEQKEAIVAQLEADKARLALTPEQEVPFAEITKKYLTKLNEVKNSGAGRKEKFQKLKDLQSQKNGEMKGLLSETQYKTYLEIQQERKERLKEKRKQK